MIWPESFGGWENKLAPPFPSWKSHLSLHYMAPLRLAIWAAADSRAAPLNHEGSARNRDLFVERVSYLTVLHFGRAEPFRCTSSTPGMTVQDIAPWKFWSDETKFCEVVLTWKCDQRVAPPSQDQNHAGIWCRARDWHQKKCRSEREREQKKGRRGERTKKTVLKSKEKEPSKCSVCLLSPNLKQCWAIHSKNVIK